MNIALNILKHSAVYSGASALGKLVGFILLPFYAHIFETEGYGVIGMVEGSIGLLSILFGAASHNAIMRVYHSRGKDDTSRNLVISTSLWLIWLSSALLVLLPLLFSEALSELLLASTEYQWVLVLGLLTFMIHMGNSAAETHLVITQKSVTFSLIGIARIIVAVSLNIYLVLILKIGIIGIFLSTFITAIMSGAIVHWIAFRDNGARYDSDTARDLSAMWLPLVPGELFDYIGRQAERFFVRFLINIDAVGVLEMAYKFPPLLGYFISQPFLRAWRTKSFEISGEPDAPVVMGKMFTNMIFLMSASALMMIVTIDELLVLLTPESFWPATGIARIEAVTTIFAAANSYFLFGLLHANQPMRITVIKTSMAALKIAISGLLIFNLGLGGAALSALLVQGLTFIWVYHASQGCYRVVMEYSRLMVIVVTAIACGLLIEYAQANGVLPGLETVTTTVDTALHAWTGSGDIASAARDKSAVIARLVVEGALASLFFMGVFILRPGLRQMVSRKLAGMLG